ncbi:MAG: hypothetical protein EXR62_17300 [Chloroflexi bacterium]|nr:hypothetical protein [Chloroflexota bacterium]
MKKIAFLALVAILALAVSACSVGGTTSNLAGAGADVSVYQGPNTNSLDNLIYVIGGTNVYAGKDASKPDKIVLSKEGDTIFNSATHTNEHRLYKVIDNHIVPANSASIADSIYTIDGDNFFSGPSSADNSKRIFTRRDDKIYKGTSSQLSDVVLSFSGDYGKLQNFLPIIADKRP